MNCDGVLGRDCGPTGCRSTKSKRSRSRNHWWNGFGIRSGSGFRLYNVSGLDAVELHLKSHDVRRIGTDDPQGLADALKALR
jgi:hypothetical protein